MDKIDNLYAAIEKARMLSGRGLMPKKGGSRKLGRSVDAAAMRLHRKRSLGSGKTFRPQLDRIGDYLRTRRKYGPTNNGSGRARIGDYHA